VAKVEATWREREEGEVLKRKKFGLPGWVDRAWIRGSKEAATARARATSR
jgi:hypothetical protein